MRTSLNTNDYERLLQLLNHGKKAVMVTKWIYGNKISDYKREQILLTEEALNKNIKDELSFSEELLERAKNVILTGELQFIDEEEAGITLIEPYFPEPKLIILGGGHISKPLVEFASKVGFSVTVVDDRPFFTNNSRFPEAERVICESFDRCFNTLNLNSSSFVVIVTRGHRHDMECLKKALNYDTAYLGMIGSKRRIKIVREELLSEGYSKDRLDKLNAPIGLDINAVTPEEIAISILAQLISYRRRSKIVNGISKTNKPNIVEFNGDIIEEVIKNGNEPRAMVTVIGTKGSVPRKAGAKMIVYSDGRTTGSIGGGCAEGEVINTARHIIRNGGYEIQRVDMTGAVAEDEGMVCGGIMEVLIERL